MNNLDKRALVLALVDALRETGSWCGETHVQKACYVLQTKFGLPTDFKFILYKHGPFSFELQDYLSQLRADDLLTSVPTPVPYGTSLSATAAGREIKSMRNNEVQKHIDDLNLVSRKLGPKKVRELERIATAVFVSEELGSESTIEDRIKRITELKKHVTPAEARDAMSEANALRS